MEAEENRLDAGPLIRWLDNHAIQAGAARAQGQIAIAEVWASKIEAHEASWLPETFAAVMSVATSAGLDRRALFELTARRDWEALHLAVLIWGYGAFANLTHDQALDSFVTTDSETRAAICEAAGRDAEQAWGLWWTADSETSLPGLRVAMGTKLLYFAGYEKAARPRPLIYDRRVHRSLSVLGYDLAHPEGRSRLVRWSHDYRPYLEVCAEAADRVGIAPDDVEFALFAAG